MTFAILPARDDVPDGRPVIRPARPMGLHRRRIRGSGRRRPGRLGGRCRRGGGVTSGARLPPQLVRGRAGRGDGHARPRWRWSTMLGGRRADSRACRWSPICRWPTSPSGGSGPSCPGRERIAGDTSSGSAVVELLDEGADGRLTTVINARAASVAAASSGRRTMSGPAGGPRASITATWSASTSASSAGRCHPRPGPSGSPRSVVVPRWTPTRWGPAVGSAPAPC